MGDSMLAKYDPKTCKDVFTVIQNRQVTALMFHDSVADLFGFLGLEGFRLMHEYQYLDESISHMDTKRHFTKAHNMLLPEGHVEAVSVIPADWYQYTRMDVPANVRQQYLQKVLTMYRDWEYETKELYQDCAGYFMDRHETDDFSYVNELVEDVSKELSCLEALMLELSAVSYDCAYVLSIQDRLSDKYSSRMKDLVM